VEGEEELVIPAGTQTGKVFRLRGKGVPYLRRNGRGDQLVVVQVSVPTKLTPEQKKMFKELSKTLGREVIPQEEKGLLDHLREALGW
ncbi:MAG: DnaJ C-terminal domain-containing protein, partial [Chloroflexota bacterium]|nr:DnaJ C-terminal domain-containing protein [Chloroflexota bacterium]